ncbi:MAG: beta-galactosidase [Bacteroides sp.]|nr:beta-galactosidase [Bacteroides sp.]
MRTLTTFLFFFLSFLLVYTDEIPHLVKQETATQLIVQGEPFLILGGESGNSTAASLDRLEKDFPKLRRMGLNTVLIPAYWELIEPREGKFDFTLIDGAIRLARQNDLKLVFLWFGVWKNSMSCYAPLWAKEDSKRFPRAYTREGKPLEIMSAFSDQVLKADMRAFS